MEKYNERKIRFLIRISKNHFETKYETKEKEFTIKTQEYQLSKKNYYIRILSILIIGFIFFFIYYRNKQKENIKYNKKLSNNKI
jgi:hypothetical protein